MDRHYRKYFRFGWKVILEMTSRMRGLYEDSLKKFLEEYTHRSGQRVFIGKEISCWEDIF